MDDGRKNWRRTQWARWWLDHGDAGAAALELEPGDELKVSESDFVELARAVFHQGLAVLYEDGHAFVHTKEEADELVAQAIRGDLTGRDRLPPARSPVPLKMRTTATRLPARAMRGDATAIKKSKRPRHAP